MKLFTLKDKKLKEVSTKPFKLEKEIKEIVEYNLKDLFELKFIKSELSVVLNFPPNLVCWSGNKKMGIPFTSQSFTF